MYFIVGMALFIAVAFTAYYFWEKKLIASVQVKPEELDTTEDEPVDFGFKQHWLAIKTTDTQKVAEALGAKQVYPCNWKKGIALAYRKAPYITPPIDGWTLVVNSDLLIDEGRDKEREIQELNRLSKLFGEAQFFVTHRIVEYHYWAKSINGVLTRAFGYLGETGENTLIHGNPTDIEQELSVENTFPDEEMVMKIAEAWSIDPTKISERTDIKGIGLVIT